MTTATRLHSHTPGHQRNCNCLDCCNYEAAWKRHRHRQQAYGQWQPFVPVAAALAHIAELNKAGMADRQIAKAAGIHDIYLREMRRTRHKIRPETERCILAVQLDLHALDPKAFLPSRGAVRRIQALRAIGWPGKHLGVRSGLSRDTMSRIFISPYVWASTMIRVRELYEDLRYQDPSDCGVADWVVERTCREAQQKNWAVPAAWTDIDTDDKPNPKVHRMGYRPTLPARPRDELVAETFNLAAGGATRTEIAQRLGLNWDSIEQAHRRGEQPLPLALRS